MFLNTQENDFRPSQSPWFSIVNIQVNKTFKCGVSIYAGVNNLLNFKPKNVILRPNDPFNNLADDPERNPNSYRFDASYIYAPNQGVKGVLGIRYTLK
jgi:outer membrane receptor for ferrienterochelin and colicins